MVSVEQEQYVLPPHFEYLTSATDPSSHSSFVSEAATLSTLMLWIHVCPNLSVKMLL